MNCDAANWTEVNLNCKVRIQVIIDARIEMFVPYHIFVRHTFPPKFPISENSHDCCNTFIKRLKQRQYSEDISQVGVDRCHDGQMDIWCITKKMTRQLSQPSVLSQTRAGWGCLLLWQVPSLCRMPPPMNLTLTWNSGEISQSKKVWLGLAHLGTLYTDTNITNANFFITWTTILLNIT